MNVRQCTCRIIKLKWTYQRVPVEVCVCGEPVAPGQRGGGRQGGQGVVVAQLSLGGAVVAVARQHDVPEQLLGVVRRHLEAARAVREREGRCAQLGGRRASTARDGCGESRRGVLVTTWRKNHQQIQSKKSFY